MNINDSLNLVIPLREDDKGPTVHGYHVPISREVFEANFRILAATRANLSSKGIQYLLSAGPSIASLTLKDEARRDSANNGDFDGQGNPSIAGAEALLQEIRRLTTVLAPGANGWASLPVDVAISNNVIDEDDWREAESAIVFFTAHSALARKAEKRDLSKATASVLKGSITSLPPMEFIASLPISTSPAPTATKAASSVPS